MNQNIWGPYFWFTLHTITFNYPLNPTKEDKINYKNFFTNFKNVIPCKICKKNYLRKLNESPIDNFLNDRKSIVYWMIDCHNKVNSETGKRNYSYNEVIRLYENKLNMKIVLHNNIYEHYNKPNKKTNIVHITLLTLVILLAIILFSIEIKNNYI